MGQNEKVHETTPKPLTAVVGVGASAGGMEALQRLFSLIPKDTGMAFIVVQHMDPRHESALVEILNRTSTLPVQHVRDAMRVEPNTVLIAPPPAELSMTDGHLQLVPKVGPRQMSIDHFFSTLADAQNQHAIGIILSGTGTDGTMGLRLLKARGGITFAQDPGEAKFDGMPRSAQLSNCVDFVLPIEQIVSELKRIASHPYIKKGEDIAAGIEESEQLTRIFQMLKKSSGVDFSHYKRSTILRRISRRMVVHRVETFKEYVSLLQQKPEEIEALYQDLLIKVSSFFRDPEVFEYLKTNVFPPMLENRAVDDPLRVWVPGCAGGEEVYSIAICLLELLWGKMANVPVQIFATDISESAIAAAREGVYPEGISQHVSPERLRRFFLKVEGGYQVSKPLRDLCIFARQNVTTDPPFSKLDMISCRNLLIYLEAKLQKRVMPVFHYALKPGGTLMLGTSETVGPYSELFQLSEKRFKIYTKKMGPVRLQVDFDTAYSGEVPEPKRGPEHVRDENSPLNDARREADRIVFSKYSAAGVVINEEFNIIQFRGGTSHFMEHAPGEPCLNLLKMARGGLGLEVRSLVHEVRLKRTSVSKSNIVLETDGKSVLVRIEVHPLHVSTSKEAFFLVLFQETPPALPGAAPQEPKAQHPAGVADQQIDQLRRELVATKEHLQSIIEEQEATNEELQSANEEILSSNEELQSINEELETAKEELQSTNEELTTVNEELQNRNHELSTVNNDLTNLLSSVNIPIVMLGSDLRIRRFTPQAEKLLSLIPGDIGRPIGDIRPRMDLPDLEKLVTEVIDSIAPRDLEVKDRQNHWYSMRVRPYKTRDNKIDGAVIALVDIDAFKRGKMQTESGYECAERVMLESERPMLLADDSLTIQAVNAHFLKRLGIPADVLNGRKIYEIREPLTQLRQPLEKLLSDDSTEGSAELKLPSGAAITVKMEKMTFSGHSGQSRAILLVI